VLKGYEKGLNSKEARQYRKMLQFTRDENQSSNNNIDSNKRNIHDDAKAIRSMRQIKNPKQFFQDAIKANKQLNKLNNEFSKRNQIASNRLKLSLALDEYKCVSINNQLKIAPERFNQISNADKKRILEATIRTINGGKQNTFQNHVKPIKGTQFVTNRENAFKNWAKILNGLSIQQHKCNRRELFENLKPREKYRLTQISYSFLGRDPRHQKIAIRFAEEMKPNNLSEFSSYIEYALARLEQQTRDLIVETNNTNNIETTETNQLLIDLKKDMIVSMYLDNEGNFNLDGIEQLKIDYLNDLKKTESLNNKLDKESCKKHEHLSNNYHESIIHTTAQEGHYKIIYNYSENMSVAVTIDLEKKEYTLTMY
jgi:hypothetical protein